MVRRGFPAEADRLAAAVRNELHLVPGDRLDPRQLADEYGIPLVPITELIAVGADPQSIRQLTVEDQGAFSAGTVLVASSRLIVFNPAHSDGRLANSVTHELAHLLLEHTPGPVIGPGGCRVWNQEMEDQADLLAGVLLVQRDAALACARVGLPHAVGAARYGVSSDLMRWRTDHSGASKQAAAAAQRQGRSIPKISASAVADLLARCDLTWLLDLTAAEWGAVLASCGRAAGSITKLAESLQEPP